MGTHCPPPDAHVADDCFGASCIFTKQELSAVSLVHINRKGRLLQSNVNLCQASRSTIDQDSLKSRFVLTIKLSVDASLLFIKYIILETNLKYL